MSSSRIGTGLSIFIATVVALVLVATSLIIGRVTATPETTPTTLSAEAGFARDMQVHHEQAVEMSYIVREQSADPAIRLLGYDIATSQGQQAGQMFGWLAIWGLPQASPEPAMTWMHRPLPGEGGAHAGHASRVQDASDSGSATQAPPETMPGMASSEQLAELREATGPDADRLFLQLMIAHHEGGVEMAEAIVRRSSNRTVTDLANSMVAAQRSEIQLMQDLLAERQPSAP
ncbi:uncharacterized protein (DUF305 family) [Leucobacter luti]|uniref:Uncharacterized protein (DUF305 family) n=1 Tax=Leucobacter luti TaxID=340320 RepID=A0A4R6S3L7_9MICO|nr:uncharacterized protein (DUF305 family) [Leucobacter luti]